MREIIGDIWDMHQRGQWVAIATNCAVNRKGEAIMGAGIAKQAKQRFPALPKLLGFALMSSGPGCHCFETLRIVSYPTKRHWKDRHSDLSLIESGAKELMKMFAKTEVIYLVRPGTGCGGLDWSEVRRVIHRFVLVSREGE